MPLDGQERVGGCHYDEQAKHQVQSSSDEKGPDGSSHFAAESGGMMSLVWRLQHESAVVLEDFQIEIHAYSMFDQIEYRYIYIYIYTYI